MQSISYTFDPDTSSLWTWFILALLLLLGCAFLMFKSSGMRSNGNSKSNPLIFLLSGMFMLIGLTITCFMGFNLIQTKTVKINEESIEIGSKRLPMKTIRKSAIHREGSGIPFAGLGASQGTDNSLIIEWNDGKSIILSEDFYPLEEIVAAIKSLKSKEREK